MKLCVGNWKMNCNIDSINKFLSNSIQKEYKNVELAIALPYIYLYRDLPIGIKKSAQDCSVNAEGAFTGDISAKMLTDFCVKYVIIGHSERRAFENEEMLARKIKNALENNITVILCVGEKLGDDKISVLKEQLKIANNIENLVIAYEPVWAIGTGKNASKEDVKVAVNFIKEQTGKMVLYGGSVNLKNCEDLSSVCDGFLIGNASLTNDFFTIADSLNKE